MSPETVLGLIMAHFVGDYILQSNWMAQEKTKRWWPAIAHGITYTLPFILVTHSIPALLVIGITHILIDHFRLAKHLNWLKNKMGPKRYRPTFGEAMANGGFDANTPIWLSSFLLFVVDNTCHVLINWAAVVWL
jgi:hypothetical protein